MLICPKCNDELYKKGTPVGLFWICPSCDGRAVALEVVRKAIPKEMANKLWQRVRSGRFAKKRRCPACTSMMSEVPIINKDKTEYLDVCSVCHFIWFDRGEFEVLPKVEVPKAVADEMPLEAKKALALAKVEMIEREREVSDIGVSSPDNWWEIILAVFGMPVVYKKTSLINKPVATWALSAVIAAVSFVAFFNLEQIITDWGLVPAQFGRHFGLTFISSFLLHAGAFHLIGNLYFLMVFGTNTEDILGRGRYLLLIALAAIVGDIAHILMDPTSNIPCIGASGGISGVLAYFCLRFPNARVGMIFYFRWVRIPVGFMFAIWVVYQFLYAYMQKSGYCNIAAAAHLGGAAVGIVFWWLTRQSFSSEQKWINSDSKTEQ